MYVVVPEGEWMTKAPNLGLPFCREPSVYIQSSGLCMGCHGIECGGVGLRCVRVVLSGRVGCVEYGSMLGGSVCVVLSVGVFACMVCMACATSHDSMFMSGVYPSIWHLSDSEKPGLLWLLVGIP
jgi:hypothetical protein